MVLVNLRVKKFKYTGDVGYIFKNQVGKACFQPNTAFASSVDLVKRTNPDEVLKEKAFDVASDVSVDAYEHGLAAIACNFLKK